MQFPYRPSSWRARVALPGALTVIGLVILALLAYLVAGDLSPREEPVGWLILVGMAVIIIWQSLLHAGHGLVAGADLELVGDRLTLHQAGGLEVWVSVDDLRPADAVRYIYRLGKPERVKGSLIRPRRRYRDAWFIPVDAATGWRLPLRSVAIMVTGGREKLGILITPDHENYRKLLEAIGVGDAQNE